MNGDRDTELGIALRELDVPEHAPDFFPRLLERLEQEAELRRRAGRIRRLRPPPFTLLGAAAAVLVMVLAVSWVALPGSDGGGLGPRNASADEVRQRVSRAVSSLRSLQGEAVVDFPFVPVTLRSSFVYTAAGDFRVMGLTRREAVAYDSRTGVRREYQVLPGGSVVAAETRGLAPGPPDTSPEPAPLLRSLASVIRSFVEADADRPVRAVDYEGRPAWRLVVPVSAELGELRPDAAALGPIGELDVTVDRRTGFPLRVFTRNSGVVSFQIRLSGLEVDRPVRPGQLRLDFPPGTLPVAPVDLGFRRLALAQMADVAGYEPLLPRSLPDGFRLADVAVAREAPAAGAGNPESRNVVSVAYRRGFDRLVVTTRAVGDDPDRWSDPFGLGGALFLSPAERVTLSAGALAGVPAEVVVRTQQAPHLWAVSDRFVVTVAGDLSRAELIEVAESLTSNGRNRR